MRISDWSSDVCSSDLSPPERPGTARHALDREYVHIVCHSAVKRGGEQRVAQSLAPKFLPHTHNVGGIVADLKRDRRAIPSNDPEIAVLQRALDHRSVAPEALTVVLRIFAIEPAEHGGEIVCGGFLHIHIVTSPARDRKSTRLNSSHYCASRMPSSA